MGPIPRSLLRLGWVGVWKDGEPIHSQGAQRISVDVPCGMRSEVQACSDEREGRLGDEGDMLGDSEEVRDKVSGDWAGPGSCPFFDPISADLQSDTDRADNEEHNSQGGFCEGTGGETNALGWRVLGEGVFHQHSGAAWQRKGDSGLREGSGWKLSPTSLGTVGLGVVLKNAAELAPRIFTNSGAYLD